MVGESVQHKATFEKQNEDSTKTFEQYRFIIDHLISLAINISDQLFTTNKYKLHET